MISRYADEGADVVQLTRRGLDGRTGEVAVLAAIHAAQVKFESGDDSIEGHLVRHQADSLYPAIMVTKVRVFEGTGYAFHDDYRPNCREGAAFELWQQIVSIFETNLR